MLGRAPEFFANHSQNAQSQYSFLQFRPFTWSIMIEGGINWYIHGTHGSKIILNYQDRPIMELQPDNRIITTKHKAMIQLQYQIMI